MDKSAHPLNSLVQGSHRCQGAASYENTALPGVARNLEPKGGKEGSGERKTRKRIAEGGQKYVSID